ncbi:sensor histidine kinase [Sabulicella glaciei]|uniref:histidine kinase n=1 Tax=Sabulicella glaciei TaxID=2984948 RepID=A0ABT3NY26_9PROT|nr:HAMP domain-containing histidine kinase [Roseococcus sp. MDT2-1-1]
MSFRSLRLRLLLAGLASILLALGAATFGLALLFERHAERQVAGELQAVAEGLVARLERGPGGGWALASQPVDPRYDRPLSGFYWQVGQPGGAVLLRSRSLWDAELAVPAAGPEPYRMPSAGPERETLLVLARDVVMPSRMGGATLRIAVARDATEIAAAAAGFRRNLLPYLGLIGAVLLLGSFAQLSVGLRPLVAVRRRLGAIRSGEAARLGDGFPSEIQPLARELDALLDQRERDIAAARARAADLAHGLKTPLQVLLGEAAMLRDAGAEAAAESVGEAAEAMRRHVERELGRARRAARGPGTSAAVRYVAERLLRVLSRTEDGARVAWHLDIPEGLRVALHEDDLAEALGTLAENAARFAASAVTLSATPEAGQVIVAVRDDGPGIAEADHAEALRRGGRLDEGGTGLGLAIAREIAEGAGGSLRLGPTGPGRMTVSLVLPAA